MIIYDKEGNQKELESVDAREYVATGRWSYEPPEPVAEIVIEVKEQEPEVETPKKGKK